jgi:hypothetical protein
MYCSNFVLGFYKSFSHATLSPYVADNGEFTVLNLLRSVTGITRQNHSMISEIVPNFCFLLVDIILESCTTLQELAASTCSVGENRSLRNVGTPLSNYMVSHHRRPRATQN